MIKNKYLGNFLSTVLLATLSMNVACAPTGKASVSASKTPLLAEEYVWYDGEREHKIWLNPNRVADFSPASAKQMEAKAAPMGAVLLQGHAARSGVRIWTLAMQALPA